MKPTNPSVTRHYREGITARFLAPEAKALGMTARGDRPLTMSF